MTNLERFNDYLNAGYKEGFAEIFKEKDGTGRQILRCWIVNEKGKRIAATTIFSAWVSYSDLGENFNTLREAKKYLEDRKGALQVPKK